MRRLSLIYAVLVLALALALAGCGGSGDGSEGEDVTASAGNAGLVDWPFFGRVPERTHYLPAEAGLLDPPLKQTWQVNTHALIEFPPAIADGVAYVINKYGNAKAVRLRDRKVLWEVTNRASDKGTPNFVTAPVYYEGRLYGAFLGGEVVAGDAEDGHTLWRRKLGGHLESSPMAAEGTLFLGTDTTDVVALRAGDGAPRWRTNLPAAIKASPSLHDGRLYVADYESSMYGLDSANGKVLWRTNTSKQPPYGEGGFFSSPAVGFGHVYAARDDGTVFALDEKTGKVAWSFDAGGPVYGSPALAEVPGTPATVYIGAENGRSLRARRRHRQAALALRHRRPHPRHRHRDRPHRLHLQLQDRQDDRARRPHPPEDLRAEASRLHPRRLRWQAPVPGRLLRRRRARANWPLSAPG